VRCVRRSASVTVEEATSVESADLESFGSFCLREEVCCPEFDMLSAAAAVKRAVLRAVDLACASALFDET
jgi:hypothetical protein